MTRIDSKLLLNAIVALKKHHLGNDLREYSDKSTTPLFIRDIPIHVQFSLSEIPRRPSPRPIRIDIPHPLYKIPCLYNNVNHDLDEYAVEVSVCLLVKDSSKEWTKELISRFPKQLSCIKKVLTLTSLRKKHATYADRRELLRRFDLFLADDRILPMLAKLLGKNFFKAKKQPVPIKITRKEELPLAVDRCLRATFMCINPGTCVTVRAGNMAMSDDSLCANIQAIATNAIPKFPRKWAMVSSILIKTPDSVSLPVYNKTSDNYEEIIMKVKDESDLLLSGEEYYPNDEDKVRSSYCNDSQSNIGEIGNKYKKQKLATRSPLIRALLKQRKVQEENTGFLRKHEMNKNSSRDRTLDKKK